MYKFTASEIFWKRFYALSDGQKESVRAAWTKFKANPFDPSLRTHKINHLSGRANMIIRAVDVEDDLRVLFTIRGSEVHTLTIGTHGIYEA